jgi:hypothetical protein
MLLKPQSSSLFEASVPGCRLAWTLSSSAAPEQLGVNQVPKRHIKGLVQQTDYLISVDPQPAFFLLPLGDKSAGLPICTARAAE